MVLFCFADGETEAQRGRSVGSRDRAGGKGRQSPGWTPAQGLDRASTAVLRWWEEGLSPTSPRPMKQDTHPGGVRGEEAWPPAGAAGLRQNPPALLSLLWTSKAAGNSKMQSPGGLGLVQSPLIHLQGVLVVMCWGLEATTQTRPTVSAGPPFPLPEGRDRGGRRTEPRLKAVWEAERRGRNRVPLAFRQGCASVTWMFWNVFLKAGSNSLCIVMEC